ncbi:hypothetical protein [Shewanella frigidimarina]|uniref:hypothetical protein n=1 Tax=Shewanella frigidimarina TaxID=56812 RepID=UPI001405546F|nr:hypothetical protein [Shewanella frigidimarina]
MQLNCDLSNEAINQEIIEEISNGVPRLQVLSICRWPELEQLEVEKRKQYDN